MAAGQEEVLLPQHLPTQLRVAVSSMRVGAAGGQRPVPEPAQLELSQEAYAHGEMPSLKAYKNRAEEDYVRQLHAHSAGDARAAARVAGVSRGHWYELLKKYEI